MYFEKIFSSILVTGLASVSIFQLILVRNRRVQALLLMFLDKTCFLYFKLRVYTPMRPFGPSMKLGPSFSTDVFELNMQVTFRNLHTRLVSWHYQPGVVLSQYYISRHINVQVHPWPPGLHR